LLLLFQRFAGRLMCSLPARRSNLYGFVV